MRLVVSIASILLTAAPALPATITLGPQKPDRPNVLMVEGLLVADDEDQFGAKTASLPSAFVAFSSDGGSLVAGLRIGEAIRGKGFSPFLLFGLGRRHWHRKHGSQRISGQNRTALRGSHLYHPDRSE